MFATPRGLTGQRWCLFLGEEKHKARNFRSFAVFQSSLLRCQVYLEFLTMKIILASKKIIIVIEPSQHPYSLFDSNCFDLLYQHIKFLRRVKPHFLWNQFALLFHYASGCQKHSKLVAIYFFLNPKPKPLKMFNIWFIFS